MIQPEIPNRTLFRAAEVCELAQLQPYVLRSWESEFPDLGVAKSAGGQRVYRRADVERVLRLKHLLFVEGLTLAGARRKLDEERGTANADSSPLEDLIPADIRERLDRVKSGLRSILTLLSNGAGHQPPLFEPAASVVRPMASARQSKSTKRRSRKN